MSKIDLSNYFASEMDKTLNSAEHKEMFSTASMLEKVAFNRVSEEGKLPSEIENELLANANSSEDCCKCAMGKHDHGCKCKCHEKTTKNDVNDAADANAVLEEVKENTSKAASTNDIVNTLLQVSASLEDKGFESLASYSLKLAERLIVEAKAKKMSKSEKDAADKKKKKSEKAKADKAKAEKAKASAKAKSSKKSPSKSVKKPSKKSDMYVARMKLGQAAPMPDASNAPQNIAPQSPNKHEAETVLNTLQPAMRKCVLTLDVRPSAQGMGEEVLVKCQPGCNQDAVYKAVMQTVQSLQSSNALPGQSYKVRLV